MNSMFYKHVSNMMKSYELTSLLLFFDIMVNAKNILNRVKKLEKIIVNLVLNAKFR